MSSPGLTTIVEMNSSSSTSTSTNNAINHTNTTENTVLASESPTAMAIEVATSGNLVSSPPTGQPPTEEKKRKKSIARRALRKNILESPTLTSEPLAALTNTAPISTNSVISPVPQTPAQPVPSSSGATASVANGNSNPPHTTQPQINFKPLDFTNLFTKLDQPFNQYISTVSPRNTSPSLPASLMPASLSKPATPLHTSTNAKSTSTTSTNTPLATGSSSFTSHGEAPHPPKMSLEDNSKAETKEATVKKEEKEHHHHHHHHHLKVKEEEDKVKKEEKKEEKKIEPPLTPKKKPPIVKATGKKPASTPKKEPLKSGANTKDHKDEKKRVESDSDDSDEDDSEEDEKMESVTRCICNQNIDQGLMIQCETCLVWQHSLCFGITKQNNVPKHWYCERCQIRTINCPCGKKEAVGKIVRCVICQNYCHTQCITKSSKESVHDPFTCPSCEKSDNLESNLESESTTTTNTNNTTANRPKSLTSAKKKIRQSIGNPSSTTNSSSNNNSSNNNSSGSSSTSSNQSSSSSSSSSSSTTTLSIRRKKDSTPSSGSTTNTPSQQSANTPSKKSTSPPAALNTPILISSPGITSEDFKKEEMQIHNTADSPEAKKEEIPSSPQIYRDLEKYEKDIKYIEDSSPESQLFTTFSKIQRKEESILFFQSFQLFNFIDSLTLRIEFIDDYCKRSNQNNESEKKCINNLNLNDNLTFQKYCLVYMEAPVSERENIKKAIGITLNLSVDQVNSCMVQFAHELSKQIQYYNKEDDKEYEAIYEQSASKGSKKRGRADSMDIDKEVKDRYQGEWKSNEYLFDSEPSVQIESFLTAIPATLQYSKENIIDSTITEKSIHNIRISNNNHSHSSNNNKNSNREFYKLISNCSLESNKYIEECKGLFNFKALDIQSIKNQWIDSNSFLLNHIPIHLYYFNDNLIIDTSKPSNQSNSPSTSSIPICRYIRRSCLSNSNFKFYNDSESHLHASLFSKSEIKETSEITIDFDYPYKSLKDPIYCPCGTSTCFVSNWFNERASLGVRMLEALGEKVDPDLLKSINRNKSPSSTYLSKNKKRNFDQIDNNNNTNNNNNNHNNNNISNNNNNSDQPAPKKLKRKSKQSLEMDPNILQSTENSSREERKLQAIIQNYEQMERKQKDKKDSPPTPITSLKNSPKMKLIKKEGESSDGQNTSPNLTTTTTTTSTSDSHFEDNQKLHSSPYGKKAWLAELKKEKKEDGLPAIREDEQDKMSIDKPYNSHYNNNNDHEEGSIPESSYPSSKKENGNLSPNKKDFNYLQGQQLQQQYGGNQSPYLYQQGGYYQDHHKYYSDRDGLSRSHSSSMSPAQSPSGMKGLSSSLGGGFREIDQNYRLNREARDDRDWETSRRPPYGNIDGNQPNLRDSREWNNYGDPNGYDAPPPHHRNQPYGRGGRFPGKHQQQQQHQQGDLDQPYWRDGYRNHRNFDRNNNNNNNEHQKSGWDKKELRNGYNSPPLNASTFDDNYEPPIQENGSPNHKPIHNKSPQLSNSDQSSGPPYKQSYNHGNNFYNQNPRYTPMKSYQSPPPSQEDYEFHQQRKHFNKRR